MASKSLVVREPKELDLFDKTPITIEGFSFRSRSVDATSRPSADQWMAAYRFAEACDDGSPYWLGDLLSYVASRSDWSERIEQMQSITKLSHRTLINRTWVARHVDLPERAIAPSLAHASLVGAMEKPEQREWLEKARDEELTVSELRDEIRASSRRKVVSGQAVLEGKYRVIYADPPWRYRDAGATVDGSLGKAERHYPTMSIDELCQLPVEAHTHKHSVLFLWVTTPLILDNPGPREVLEAWGFTYKSMLVWDKVLGMPGRFFQVQHEMLLVCERGSCAPDEPLPKPKSVYTERRTDVHSQKPHEARKLIERLYTKGPYLELFGREPVEGWSVFGNDAKLWT